MNRISALSPLATIAAAISLFFCMFSPAHALDSARPPASIKVLSRSFLASLLGPDGQTYVTTATTVPYVVEKSCYNWRISFEPVAGDVELFEELILPGPAPLWGVADQPTVVNQDRASAVTLRRFDGREGVAISGWCVAEADPVGPYLFIIRQAGREIARFDFIVGDLK